MQYAEIQKNNNKKLDTANKFNIKNIQTKYKKQIPDLKNHLEMEDKIKKVGGIKTNKLLLTSGKQQKNHNYLLNPDSSHQQILHV